MARQELEVAELLSVVGEPVKARQAEVAQLFTELFKENPEVLVKESSLTSTGRDFDGSLETLTKETSSLRAAHAARTAAAMAKDALNGSLGGDSKPPLKSTSQDNGLDDDIEAVQARILGRIGNLPRRRW